MKHNKVLFVTSAVVVLVMIVFNFSIANSVGFNQERKLSRSSRIIPCYCIMIGPSTCTATNTGLQMCEGVLSDPFFCSQHTCPLE